MGSVYPPVVLRLCHSFDAWVVGSAARPDNRQPRDFDVLVPFCQWHAAISLVPRDAQPNSFAGWKFADEDGNLIDVWPGDLSWLAQRPQFTDAHHPASGTRITRSPASTQGKERE